MPQDSTGKVSGAHSETDDQRIFRWPRQECERQVGDHLGDGREAGHADSVDQKLFLDSGRADGGDCGGAVTADFPRRELALKTIGGKNQNQRDQANERWLYLEAPGSLRSVEG